MSTTEEKTYFLGSVYKITNDVNADIYIGSTKQSLSKRFAKHKRACERHFHIQNKLYCAMETIGVDHFTIELIEEIRCSSREELLQVEQSYIDRLNPALNTNRAYLSPEQKAEANKLSCREWRQRNSERAREYRRRYCEEARSRIKCTLCRRSFAYESQREAHYRTRKHRQLEEAFVDEMLSRRIGSITMSDDSE